VPETRRRTKAGPKPPIEPVPHHAGGEPAGAAVCTVAFCPICMAVTTAQGAAPEAVEHLLNAAREFFLAARAVIDARGDDLERSKGPGPRTIERIDIA
jgi:hypothetical protein